MPPIAFLRCGVALFAIAFATGLVRAEAPSTPTFEKDIRPLFKAHCFECHGDGAKLRGGLDLRLRRLAVEGGDTGPALEPGKADKSLLVERVRSGEMPPGKRKLTKDEIGVLERWIAAGA